MDDSQGERNHGVGRKKRKSETLEVQKIAAGRTATTWKNILLLVSGFSLVFPETSLRASVG